MIFDALIIVSYFVIIMVVGIAAAQRHTRTTAEEYFLASRSLRWPSIAISTIATNIHAGHFLGMAGSAYLFGLAQANLEINAIFGILMATFIFVPYYLRARVTTISEFFGARFGPNVGLTYSVLMMVLYAFMYLGSALFWGAWAIDGIFGEFVSFLGDSAPVRLGCMVVILGVFSATYTYLGGLSAVVRTDMVQFALLVVGGLLMLGLAIHELGGWSELYRQTPHKMHLHLPADHKTLPWIALIGMNLLNLNYWGANQIILQRAIAAKSLAHAQIGLLVGGVLKYLMVLIIIVPAIALVGITAANPLTDPDQAYATMVKTLLPSGVRGIILCGLFASLMSTVDSIFNSVSTLWSVDIYKRYIKTDANDMEMVRAAKWAIVGTLLTGVSFALVQIYIKFDNPEFPLTHWFNELSYTVKNGFVLLIVAATFLLRPSPRLVLTMLVISIPLTMAFKLGFPDMNYFVRSMWIIVGLVLGTAIPTWAKHGWRLEVKLVESSSPAVARFGVALAASLIACHIVFH